MRWGWGWRGEGEGSETEKVSREKKGGWGGGGNIKAGCAAAEEMLGLGWGVTGVQAKEEGLNPRGGAKSKRWQGGQVGAGRGGRWQAQTSKAGQGSNDDQFDAICNKIRAFKGKKDHSMRCSIQAHDAAQGFETLLYL